MVPYDEPGLQYLLREYYVKPKRKLRANHPRDILEQLIDVADYLEVNVEMSISEDGEDEDDDGIYNIASLYQEQDDNDEKFTIGGEVENNDEFKKPRRSLYRKLRQSISLNDYLSINY